MGSVLLADGTSPAAGWVGEWPAVPVRSIGRLLPSLSAADHGEVARLAQVLADVSSDLLDLLVEADDASGEALDEAHDAVLQAEQVLRDLFVA